MDTTLYCVSAAGVYTPPYHIIGIFTAIVVDGKWNATGRKMERNRSKNERIVQCWWYGRKRLGGRVTNDASTLAELQDDAHGGSIKLFSPPSRLESSACHRQAMQHPRVDDEHFPSRQMLSGCATRLPSLRRSLVVLSAAIGASSGTANHETEAEAGQWWGKRRQRPPRTSVHSPHVQLLEEQKPMMAQT